MIKTEIKQKGIIEEIAKRIEIKLQEGWVISWKGGKNWGVENKEIVEKRVGKRIEQN